MFLKCSIEGRRNFVMGARSTLCFDRGYDPIFRPGICRAAARTIGINFRGVINNPNAPKGCVKVNQWVSATRAEEMVKLNKPSGLGRRSQDHKPVCRSKI